MSALPGKFGSRTDSEDDRSFTVLMQMMTNVGHDAAAPSYDHAVTAYREARFGDASSLLEGIADPSVPRAFLLFARILVRASATDAIALLARNVDSLAAERDRNEAFLLLAAAQARVGDVKSAHLVLKRVDEALRLETGPDAHLVDELQYRRAATLWMERRLDEAEATLRSLLQRTGSRFYVEGLILDAAISAARERFEQQAATLLRALETVTSQAPRDILHWAHVTAQLAYLSREMSSPSLRTAVYDNVDVIPWTVDIADLHFKTLKAVGWRRALDGDYLSAFRFLKRAGRVAPTDAWRVMALCDRALLAQSLGERRFTEQELDDVSELASHVEWRAIDGEERLALLLLAVLYAPTDGALALSYIARFQETGDRFHGTSLANADRRPKAMVSYSLGYVYARLNYRDDALVFLKEAWTTFDATGYDWRAARCAMEIAQLTTEPLWANRARAKIAQYPRSWMISDIEAVCVEIENASAAGADPDVRRTVRESLLTPAQREVYLLLMDGFAISAIAKQLARSEFTIRNHVKAIFKAFDVNSRAALMRVPVHGATARR